MTENTLETEAIFEEDDDKLILDIPKEERYFVLFPYAATGLK